MSTEADDKRGATPALPDIGAAGLEGLTTRAGAATPVAAPRATIRQRLLHNLLHNLRLLLIAVWLGSAVFFGASVAPSAFAVLPSRELAGALVARTLAVVNVGGFIMGLLLLAGALVGRRLVRWYAWLAETLALAVLAAAAFVGHFLISARMSALRTQMGRPIEELAQDDAMRVAFNALHGQSVTALTVAMVAGAIALLLIARRTK